MSGKVHRVAEILAHEIPAIEAEERRKKLAALVRSRVRWAEDLADEMKKYAEIGNAVSGLKMPWEKTHDLFRFAEQEITIFAGMSGHMKSTTLSQIALHIANEAKVGILSLEMPVGKQLHVMSQQLVAKDEPSSRDQDRLIAYAGKKICFFESTEIADAEKVYGCIWAMYELGCKFLILDNLQMFIGKLDNEAETEFIKEVRQMAIACQIHIVIVHHVRKPPDGLEAKIPSKHSVRGSGGLTDLAHNTLIVFHNQARANALWKQANNYPLSEADRDLLADGVDYTISVAKQRSGEFQGSLHLWSGNGRTLKEYSDSADCRVMAPS